MSFIDHSAQEFDFRTIGAFNANISASALYYAAGFCGEYGAISGVRIAPHVSGKGVVLIALDGSNMGIFYDAAGHINGKCTLRVSKPFRTAIKPAKTKKIVDNRVIIADGHVRLGVGGPTLDIELHALGEKWTLDAEHLLSLLERSAEKANDTVAIHNVMHDRFLFPAYPTGSDILYTQYQKVNGSNARNSPFMETFYVIRHTGYLPFEFVGVAMPFEVSSEAYAKRTGLPTWL